MEKRRIRLEINGVVCGLITQESEEYMQNLADEVGELMREITEASPYITREAAALTAALSYCDDSKKGERKAFELQERVDELEVEAEIWQEDKEELLKKASAEADAALIERMQKLEHENTALEESAGRLRETKEAYIRLKDENEALREAADQTAAVREDAENLARQLSQREAENLSLHGELEELRARIEQLENEQSAAVGENDTARAEEDERVKELEAENSSLRAEVKHAEQEKLGAISAAKRAVEEAKRRMDEMEHELNESRREAEKYKKEAQSPALDLLESEARRQGTKSELRPEDAAKRRNPLRFDEELEKEGFVSFFEKKK